MNWLFSRSQVDAHKLLAPENATEIYVHRRPETTIDAHTFGVRHVRLPHKTQIPSDCVLVRVLWVSADPAMRTWLSPRKNYIAPVAVGAPMRALGVGRALTGARGVPVGSLVTGLLGWRSACVMKAASLSVATPLPSGVPVSALLGALGTTGLTAYFGLLRVGAAKSSDVVLISAAAGATGGVAVQIARRVLGCKRVVGIAGGAAKCKHVVEHLGAHACVDYKAPHFATRLRAQVPDGIDLYFDNVGGHVLEAALKHLTLAARVVLCGAISGYNSQTPPRGPRNYLTLLTARASMAGFIVTDFAEHFPKATRDLAKWVRDAKVVVREDVVDGLENAPNALARLFDGQNIGKVVIRVHDELRDVQVVRSKL